MEEVIALLLEFKKEVAAFMLEIREDIQILNKNQTLLQESLQSHAEQISIVQRHCPYCRKPTPTPARELPIIECDDE